MSSDDSKSAPVAAPAMDAKAMKVAKRVKKLQKASTPIAPVSKLPAWLTSDVDLFDFDCNLTHPEFEGQAPALIAEAKEVRVTQMLVPGATLEESRQCLDLARLYPTVLFPTAGVHPYNATSAFDPAAFAMLSELAKQPEMVAVGECGLDYSPGFPSPELQLEWFLPQLDLACDLQKPLFLHERLAHEPFVAALTERAAKLPPAVVHCFTGTAAEAATYVSMGLYIGVTGFICKSHGATLQSLLRDGVVPLDRLVVETDAPYMGFPHCRKLAAAHPKKQYPNVATALPSVVEALAECLGLPAKDVAAATTYNARKFLRLL
ncbi:hypothetical protein SPRG_10615 [Saprolegnia parasitica CBS 223.65]|uniref:TatD DNase n=1 Tax=Saprolegnia parasitica (strain CBS 223.65) TaxID=695850 RepID=A0A067CBN7_SAPPC|nr:hypothetical protein SPRG_10615 [Saprolegnia parasitica CBS 223.65]KDO24187.1 hypothetical protein SPRG_10615 [Saprolegnia parasitica CBS 223.65]|eukprot:XP_012205131.1 hypothetical protein SPRG_10615 [Saprolegnia parasitica CBS 223.65]